MRGYCLSAILVSVGLVCSSGVAGAEDKARVYPAGQINCRETSANCWDYDAIVFVHGIYGSKETFRNESTAFDWPTSIRTDVAGRHIDVYQLEYSTALLKWARSEIDDFIQIQKDMFDALKPVRSRQYRSIGFIAHSLGGIMVQAYLAMVKTTRGSAGMAQHAYVITLATPYTGAQLASLGGLLKTALFMRDDLLDTLSKDNRLLKFVGVLRENLQKRSMTFGCRPTSTFVAVETKPYKGIAVVDPESAIASYANEVSRFAVDHVEIAKPRGPDSEAYRWVDGLVEKEIVRINSWAGGKTVRARNRPDGTATEELLLCGDATFIPE